MVTGNTYFRSSNEKRRVWDKDEIVITWGLSDSRQAFPLTPEEALQLVEHLTECLTELGYLPSDEDFEVYRARLMEEYKADRRLPVDLGRTDQGDK